MATRTPKKPGKSMKDLPAKSVRKSEDREVRGGRDAASGLATGKRMHKPY